MLIKINEKARNFFYDLIWHNIDALNKDELNSYRNVRRIVLSIIEPIRDRSRIFIDSICNVKLITYDSEFAVVGGVIEHNANQNK